MLRRLGAGNGSLTTTADLHDRQNSATAIATRKPSRPPRRIQPGGATWRRPPSRVGHLTDPRTRTPDDPVISSGRTTTTQLRSRAKEARTTGCRRTTGTTQRTSTRGQQPDERRRLVGLRQQASTRVRSPAGRQLSRIAVGDQSIRNLLKTRTTNARTASSMLEELLFRTLCSAQMPHWTRAVNPQSAVRSSAGPGLREHQGTVRGVHRPANRRRCMPARSTGG